MFTLRLQLALGPRARPPRPPICAGFRPSRCPGKAGVSARGVHPLSPTKGHDALWKPQAQAHTCACRQCRKAKNDGRKSFPGRRVACVGKANERSWSLYGTVLTQRVTPQYRQGPPPSSKCGRICGNGIPGGGMGVEPPRQTRRPHATVRAFQIQFVGV